MRLTVSEWIPTVKADLLQLQKETGLPALAVAAQFCHEAFNGDGSMSDLAAGANNFGGMKWADWQREFGCKPVTYGTWEEVDGQTVSLDDAFCWCPDWQTWLKVYRALMTGRHYGPCIVYASDPFLWLASVWAKGYATDSRYLAGRDGKQNPTGTVTWFFKLWGEFLPAPPVEVSVEQPCGRQLCVGHIDGTRTMVPLRAFAEALGFMVEWRQTPPAAIVSHPSK